MTRKTEQKWISLLINENLLYEPVLGHRFFCFQYNSTMKWYGWLGLFFIGISTYVIVVSILPVPVQLDQISFSSQSGMTGTLQLTQRNQIRLGDTTEIRLQISVDQALNTSTPIVIYSKLELDNMSIEPRGVGTTMFDPKNPIELNWQLRPHQGGKASGTLWLFFETEGGTRDMILARTIQITVKSFFGLSYQPFKIVSIACVIFGVAILLTSLKKTRPITAETHL